MPILCPVAYVDSIPMLDGGICDSIPINRSIEQGYIKNVVILTRNKGYRKESKDIKVPSFIYRKYPAMRAALSNRNSLYNSQLDLVDKLEAEGSVFVLRPQKPITVDRIEKDTDKLTELYEEGYEAGKLIQKMNFVKS